MPIGVLLWVLSSYVVSLEVLNLWYFRMILTFINVKSARSFAKGVSPLI